MKKVLRILAILGVCGVIASLFIPTVIIYADGIPAPDKEGSKDPHWHYWDNVKKENFTVCFDEEAVDCDESSE